MGGGVESNYLRLFWDDAPSIGIGPEVTKKKDWHIHYSRTVDGRI